MEVWYQVMKVTIFYRVSLWQQGRGSLFSAFSFHLVYTWEGNLLKSLCSFQNRSLKEEGNRKLLSYTLTDSKTTQQEWMREMIMQMRYKVVVIHPRSRRRGKISSHMITWEYIFPYRMIHSPCQHESFIFWCLSSCLSFLFLKLIHVPHTPHSFINSP